MTPTIINLPIANANQEYAVLLPPCNLVIIQARIAATIQISYVQGQSNSNFITIPAGCSKSIQFGANGFNSPIYFWSLLAAQTIEIECWN